MINMFNEKIYLFLWWWMLVVAILTTINLIYWTVISLMPNFGYNFVGRYLGYKGLGKSRIHVENFVDTTLRKDGVTVLRLISDNCGDLVTAEIVEHLWKIYDQQKSSSVPNLADNSEKKRLIDNGGSDTSTEKMG